MVKSLLRYVPGKAGRRLAHAHPPGLRGHGDSQTVVFFPPKTPPRHFHHQKVLCDDANIYICIALKIINTPVNRLSSLHQLWVSTGPKREAPSQHHDRGLCHLGSVETITVGSNLTILDQIAKFFLLLSDAPSYWFTINTSCDHAFHLSK
jgi:hypothetical protein